MKHFILVLISLGFAFVLAEAITRVFGPDSPTPYHFYFDKALGPIPFPNERGSRTVPGVYNYTYTQNSLGLRGDEPGPKTRSRILVLGDSFTYGVGVSDNETFSSVLQAQLPQYQIINAGNPGQGTEYGLKFYRTVGRTLQPDIVILCFYANDFNDNQRGWYYNSQLQEVSGFKPPLVGRSSIYSWLIDHSVLVKTIRLVIVARLIPPPPEPESRNELLTKQFLSALNADVASSGAKFLLFYIRERGIVSEDEIAFMRIVKELHLQAIAFDVPTSQYLREGHWNAEGHQLAASTIAGRLNQQN